MYSRLDFQRVTVSTMVMVASMNVTVELAQIDVTMYTVVYVSLVGWERNVTQTETNVPQTTPPVLETTSTASILTAVMSVDVTPAMREQGLTAKVYRSCFSPLECFTMFEMIHMSVFYLTCHIYLH